MSSFSCLIFFLPKVTLEVYKKLKDEYFGFVRQAGELDLQSKEMEVVEISPRIDSFFYLHSEFTTKRSLSFLLFRRTSSPRTTAWAGWRGSCGLLKIKIAPGGKLPIPGRCGV